MAIEAAVEAERRHVESRGEQQRLMELELQQAQYEASLAERRYAACDPDNRLIAAQLEKSWEADPAAGSTSCRGATGESGPGRLGEQAHLTLRL